MINPKKRDLFLVVIIAVLIIAIGAPYLALSQLDRHVHQAFDVVRAEYQQRLAAVPPALLIARSSDTVAPQLVSQLDAAYQRALQIPPEARLLDDDAAFDHFNRLQGDMTMAIFQLMSNCVTNRAVHEHPDVKALRAQYEGEHVGPSSPHSRYAEAAGRLNQLIGAAPIKSIAQKIGFKSRPEFVRAVMAKKD
jgi:hypothetical protein